MSQEVAVIICTEPGFENKSVLLVRSIRQWAGSLSDIGIYSISPRNRALSEFAMAEFEKHKVQHICMDLNTEFADYNLANKPVACDYWSKELSSKFLIFMDSDQVILNEPTSFILSNDSELAVRPVDRKNIGIESFDDEETEYWKNLYSICGKQPTRKYYPSIGDNSIYEYFNSGLTIARNSTELYQKWHTNFQSVMRKKFMPIGGEFFIEQSVFAATVTAEIDSVEILDNRYNYPIHVHNKLPSSGQITHFNQFVTIHYHKMFDDQEWLSNLESLENINTNCAQYEWLIENLYELSPTPVKKQLPEPNLLKRLLRRFSPSFLSNQ